MLTRANEVMGFCTSDGLLNAVQENNGSIEVAQISEFHFNFAAGGKPISQIYLKRRFIARLVEHVTLDEL